MDRCIKTKKCGWKGTDNEKVQILNDRETKKYGMKIYTLCCPKCGGKTFYPESA